MGAMTLVIIVGTPFANEWLMGTASSSKSRDCLRRHAGRMKSSCGIFRPPP
jgi:hypothetical protein